MSLVQKFNLFKLALTFPGIGSKKLKLSLLKNSPGIGKDFPRVLKIFLYSGCNLKCSMCGQWRRRNENGPSGQEKYLPLSRLQELVNEAAPYLPELYIWGGEPTLHPDFAKFIGYAKAKGLVCTVNTNGTTLQALAEDIIASDVDSMDVSLDGPPEIHDSIRGFEGTYGRIMKGLAALEKNRTGTKPLVKAIITLSEKNLDHVERLLWDLEVHPSIHMSIIQLGWFTTAAAGGKYERELKERFGACGLSWKGFEDNSAPKRSRLVFELVQRIRNGHFRKPVLFFPDLDGERILRYYSDPSDTLAMKGCKALYRDAHIMPNGDVVVCGDFPDMVMGNVTQQSLREIWKGERIRQFRQSIEKQGLFSICPRCCGFFE